MKKILITRRLLRSSEDKASKIFNVKLNREDKLLTKEELISKFGWQIIPYFQTQDCDGK